MSEITHSISVALPAWCDSRVMYNVADATIGDVKRLIDELECAVYVAHWSHGPGYGGDDGEPIDGFIARNRTSLAWLREQGASDRNDGNK